MFLRILKHLLPNARAWRITTDKQLRQFFEGLTGLGQDIKDYVDRVWLDIFPFTTRELDVWDIQFGLPNTGITEAQRRTRLDGAWKAFGGQSVPYIQNTLQNAGFDVFVHEWWIPGTEPPPGTKECVTPRNPQDFIRRSSTLIEQIYIVGCGEELMECGEEIAECANTTEPIGYPLVNIVAQTEPDFIVGCGEALMECGEADALCGNFFEFRNLRREYIVPDDPNKWPYFLYISAETFPNPAVVDPKRRDEFEAQLLKICPLQQWLGVVVQYY